jgi:hypothetical protein
MHSSNGSRGQNKSNPPFLYEQNFDSKEKLKIKKIEKNTILELFNS